jgi:hypothetical protein
MVLKWCCFRCGCEAGSRCEIRNFVIVFGPCRVPCEPSLSVLIADEKRVFVTRFLGTHSSGEEEAVFAVI